MATSRLPPATLTLKQVPAIFPGLWDSFPRPQLNSPSPPAPNLRFVRRQQVLLLYRRILQAIRQVPKDSDRKYLKDWAREEFKRNKSATDEVTIRMMITQGNMQLKGPKSCMWLASHSLPTTEVAHKKKYSTPLFIREMQIKTTMRYYTSTTCTRMAVIKKGDNY
uniref:LYR motif-containing protein 2 n=1 Tax=Myotis myotis TaxID=51298 RepID=A0A7J7WWK7_MYOMY|nr:LYR motif containing 2 [Myotis myotis]